MACLFAKAVCCKQVIHLGEKRSTRERMSCSSFAFQCVGLHLVLNRSNRESDIRTNFAYSLLIALSVQTIRYHHMQLTLCGLLLLSNP